MSYKGTILIIDDNNDLLEYLKDFFMIYDYEVILAETGNEGIEKFREYLPDIVISDMRLPDKNGNIVVKEIKAINKDVPIIIITGFSDKQLILSAMRNGALDLLKKPFKPKDLKYLINKIDTLFRKIKVKLSSSFIDWEKRQFRISNDIYAISSVVNFVFSNIDYISEDVSFMKNGLQELLINAVEHGNLNISYEEKQELLEKGDYNRHLKEKASLPAYRDKYVMIKVFSTADYLKIIIEDMGNGFDLSSIPDPENPENFLKESGKGILMALHAYDKVEYNEIGNCVTLFKYADGKQNIEIHEDGKESFEIFDKLQYYTRLKKDYDFELNLAREFQTTFLPRKDEIAKFSGVKSDYIFKPWLQVSGDFIDMLKLDNNVYGYFISDISGHGVAAALISSMLKVFFSLYGKDVLDTQGVYVHLNREFYSYLNSGEYFTSFYGIYFQEERRFMYTNANHPPPFLLRAKTGEIIPLNTEGFFVGIFNESRFDNKEVFLEPGDRILFYSDGITQARNPEDGEFGEERLIEIYKKGNNISISDLLNKIFEEVKNFSNHKIDDDVTIAMIEIE
ncbi:MAG: SpoIIE family protein phosphatase, partial [Candidatus Aminicenantes bacterium]|nr:SpoIIE family protein phosphatase [Candidatus Aminicenantes bacterium]